MVEINNNMQSAELISQLRQLIEEDRIYRKNRDRIVTATEKIIAVLQATLSPCSVCSVRGNCISPCELLEAQLPGKYVGKFHGEGTTSLNLDKTRDDRDLLEDLEEENMKKLDHGALKSLQKVISPDLFSQYEACWHIFTKKQREVLTKFYREGKSKTQIAKEIDKAISTIHDLLKRAEQRKQRYYEKSLQKF